jgi:hypothetical protein
MLLYMQCWLEKESAHIEKENKDREAKGSTTRREKRRLVLYMTRGGVPHRKKRVSREREERVVVGKYREESGSKEWHKKMLEKKVADGRKVV